MVDPVSIPEAADILGLSQARVRVLAVGGQLAATKVGGRWLLERAAVEARQRRKVPGGRPLAPHNAWALLLLASGKDVEAIDPVVRSRLRRALALEGLEQLGPRLVRRAEARFFSAHPGEISYLLDDQELVGSGISAAGAYGFDLVSGQEADGYVCAGALKELAAAHALSPAGPEGNICLRVVPSEAWHFLADAQVAPVAAVALDLAEDPDPRSARAGRAALRDLNRHHGPKRAGRQPAMHRLE
jgi:excisionase family DNA binding protein